jgi:SAM-dependent methyltransferase
MKPVNEHNRRAWDQRARDRQRHTANASDKDFLDPLTVVDPYSWLPRPISGRRVLCLASGGGRQGPLLAAAGAKVTVVDLSPEMLKLDREVATRRGLELKTVATSMDNLHMLADGSFDIVLQPVSTCYVPEILNVYCEAARILAGGGLYLSKHKQPASLQATLIPSPRHYVLNEPYYRSGALPPSAAGFHRESGTLEFLHRWEELLGGLCRAGFVIEDVKEPKLGKTDAEAGTYEHRCGFVPPYIELKARRLEQPRAVNAQTSLWTP